ncbi:unknown [Proteobacteria bacterium CAG:495]|jgi:chromosome undetermined scaffold_9, whole genome shotgun sequence|nr:unknown [Proteobacteria bacterium CAG:495]
MYEQIISIFSSSEILATVSNNIDDLATIIDGYLSGANNLRIASIILMLLAFILFLFLVIIIYVKSIVSFLKSDNKNTEKDDGAVDDIFNEEDAERLNRIMSEEDRERELEKELQKELELARAEKEMFEQREMQEKQRKDAVRREEKANTREREKETKEKEQAEEKESEPKGIVVDLDWKKGKLRDLEQNAPTLSNEFLSYHQSTKDLSELLGLIIDMIGRGVDDLKIAQTVMFRNQGKNSEDDILQIIDSIKDFIALCINQNFDRLPNASQLPREEDALFHLAQGDPTLALAMLEALMDFNIDRSSMAGIDVKKDEIFKEISAQSCVFGSLAAINDIHLATGAFELAIELNPNNVNAWCRLGDMYAKADSNNKAVWAYQNVLTLADEEIYARQVANANKMMSQHLYAQGNSLQAAKLYNSSKQYYDSLGINRRLDKQEVEIIEIIEAHQKEELQATIQKILSQKTSSRAFSFA